jgi:hypothetical protein
MSEDTTLHNVAVFRCPICLNKAMWDLDLAGVQNVYEVTVRLSKRVDHALVPVGERGGVVCGNCKAKAERLWKRMKGNEGECPLGDKLRTVHDLDGSESSGCGGESEG